MKQKESRATEAVDWFSLDDDILIKAHLKGDPKAFEVLFKKYREQVARLVYSIVKHEALVQDIVQEVFLLVFRHLSKFRQNAAFKTWIYRITVNCCRSKLRRRGRRRLEGRPEHLEELADQRAGPEEQTLGHDLGRRLAAAIASLPVAFREAVVLRDVQGLSYGEIGDVLGVRIGTVRSRIARGRERLRGLLEEAE